MVFLSRGGRDAFEAREFDLERKTFVPEAEGNREVGHLFFVFIFSSPAGCWLFTFFFFKYFCFIFLI